MRDSRYLILAALVTLKRTVASAAAKERAATIARGTEGVTRVVNQLVVK